MFPVAAWATHTFLIAFSLPFVLVRFSQSSQPPVTYLHYPFLTHRTLRSLFPPLPCPPAFARGTCPCSAAPTASLSHSSRRFLGVSSPLQLQPLCQRSANTRPINTEGKRPRDDPNHPPPSFHSNISSECVGGRRSRLLRRQHGLSARNRNDLGRGNYSRFGCLVNFHATLVAPRAGWRHRCVPHARVIHSYRRFQCFLGQGTPVNGRS